MKHVSGVKMNDAVNGCEIEAFTDTIYLCGED
jgi:hypothetical protein